MLWIKELEMVDSVDDLESSRSIQGYHFQDFEMLDAKIASAMNKIIQNSCFKKKISPEEQKAQLQDRFVRGRQIAFMIHEYFRVTGAHDTVLDYADLFSITLRNDDVQEFDTKRNVILLSMSKIPAAGVLESLCKLRSSKTVLDLYEPEIHEKISKRDYQKLKTMVKRSLEQKIKARNSETRDEMIETGAVVKNRREKRWIAPGLRDCHHYKAQGQCSKGDTCSFRHEGPKSGKWTPKSAPSSDRPEAAVPLGR